MPPIVVHQDKEYSQYLHQNIPLEWKFHHTPYGYMDRYQWLKTMSNFSNICGASPINNQIILFDGHDSQFDDCYPKQMQRKKIEPLILKAVDSINDQPKDNGPNKKLKALCNTSEAKWMLNCGTLRFQPYHMNSVLVETQEAFTISADNNIRDSFAKTRLLPSALPTLKQIHMHVQPPSKHPQKASIRFQKTNLHLFSCLIQRPTTLR